MKSVHGFRHASHVAHTKIQNKLAIMTDIINGAPMPTLEITTPAVFNPGVTLVELEPSVSGG